MPAAGLVVDAPAEQGERRLVGRVENDQLLLVDARQDRLQVVGNGDGQPVALQRSDDRVACSAVGRDEQNPVGQRSWTSDLNAYARSRPAGVPSDRSPSLAIGARSQTPPNGTRPA
jgi:hypothetical protein